MSASLLDSVLEKSVIGSFTSIGHRARSRNWTDIGGNALVGRTLLITGATSGIGRIVALEAARLGANVRFVARNAAKADLLRQEMIDATGRDDFHYYLADLSLVSEVDAVADEILAEEPAIHILINNAVVLPSQRLETAEGLELAHATNLVSPFLLTNRLRERLVESAPARIINVISGGMYTTGLALDDINSERGEYRGSVAYAQAKRRLMVLTKMWADLLAGTGVTVNATHPGWVDTPGVQNSLPTFHRLARPLLRSSEQGADTIVWLAADEPGGRESGKLWHDRAVRSEYKLKSTIESSGDRNALWQHLSETVDRLT